MAHENTVEQIKREQIKEKIDYIDKTDDEDEKKRIKAKTEIIQLKQTLKGQRFIVLKKVFWIWTIFFICLSLLVIIFTICPICQNFDILQVLEKSVFFNTIIIVSTNIITTLLGVFIGSKIDDIEKEK